MAALESVVDVNAWWFRETAGHLDYWMPSFNTTFPTKDLSAKHEDAESDRVPAAITISHILSLYSRLAVHSSSNRRNVSWSMHDCAAMRSSVSCSNKQ
jgi:hypothetical protein